MLAVRLDLALALLERAVAPGELVDLDLELALEVTQLLGREWILEREGAERRGGVLEDLARAADVGLALFLGSLTVGVASGRSSAVTDSGNSPPTAFISFAGVPASAEMVTKEPITSAAAPRP